MPDLTRPAIALSPRGERNLRRTIGSVRRLERDMRLARRFRANVLGVTVPNLFLVKSSQAIVGATNQWVYVMERCEHTGTNAEVAAIDVGVAGHVELSNCYNRYERFNDATEIGHGQQRVIAGVGDVEPTAIPNGAGPFVVDGPFYNTSDPANPIFEFYAINPMVPECEA